MMQVKKYRAATTREALEQIKNDLGQDAFVLETKQVRKAGFLGLGKGYEIEISAAIAPGSKTPGSKTEEAPKAAAPVAVKKQRNTGGLQSLNLRDESPAAPIMSPIMSAVMPAMSAETPEARPLPGELETLADLLTAKQFTEAELDEATDVPYTLESIFANRAKTFEPLEVSPEAPKVVHPRREVIKKAVELDALTEEVLKPAKTVAPALTPQTLDNREFEMLRNEIRDLKFSLGKAAFGTHNSKFHHDTDKDFLGEIYDSPFYETYVELVVLGIPSELARNIVMEITPDFRSGMVSEEDISRLALTSALSSRLTFEADPIQMGPRAIAMIGATGVGKTTTIAKLAARAALKEGRRVELIALDTYRIGAVEQLKTYAEIIGAGCHTVRSVLELDALLRRLPKDATVLIDTTGKSPHDLADQYELSEYLRYNDDIRKCLVVQATTHPADAAAAIRKFDMYGVDCLTITKFDETERPGALIEAIAESELPLAYFCMGQRVPEDLQEANLKNLVNRILPENK